MTVSKIESINDEFKCPIYYNEKKIELKENLMTDLELITTIDPSNTPMYHHVFSPENPWSKKVIEQMATHYTTDTRFLTDSQTLMMNYSTVDDKNLDEEESRLKHNKMYDDVIKIWDEIKLDSNFKDKYYYLDWKFCEFLNNNASFLQAMSMYNMYSPVFSLLVPVLILIFPFFIIKARGLKVTVKEYVDILKVLASNHAIGRIFTDFSTVSNQQKIYMLISAGFYIFSIYQNFNACYRFYKNMKRIHEYLNTIKSYCEFTVNKMKNFLVYSNPLSSFAAFNKMIEEKIVFLVEFGVKCSKITNYTANPKKIAEIGHILKTFYELYNDANYNSAFLYSFGFHGYVDSIVQLKGRIENKQIQYAEFIDGTKKSEFKRQNEFKGAYYAALVNESPIKNNVKLKKNMIITGPNASGKTTILKTTLINIILSQQWGCGFYDSAKLLPYHHIHCYLNIPDTSGRDSLFQAEARRCKEIIDIIDEKPQDNHFCVFDELYSGTNPDEAVISAVAFMEYLVKKENISCMLTTHFVKVCKRLKKNKKIQNFHMETKPTENDPTGKGFKYTYLLGKGISTVKGGFKVLSDMNYPNEIIENTNELSKTI